jgi:beta-xylosidase
MTTPASCTENTHTGNSGDQGDGTFRNPVLAFDYSDPCPIRVGQDYYLASSTFQMSPGVPILHSRDLVNWTTIGAAIPDLSVLAPEFNWDRMDRFGGGVFAPSLRYHDGKFWVFVNCYTGEGFYVCTATNPAGPWQVRQIKDRNGKPLRTTAWTDPCPFWDDDGKAYLISSRPGGQWFGYLFEMAPDGSQLFDADVDHMNDGDGPYVYPRGGTMVSPFQSTEGNKILKRNGYYYLVHIEFLDSGQGRGTYVFRSRHIYGVKPDGMPGKPGDPGKYEVFKFGPVNDQTDEFYGRNLELPGQGGFVDTPDGRWFWIGQFNRFSSDGRLPQLLPVTWIDDWPVPGVDIQDGHGRMAWHLPKPIAGYPACTPQGSDDFKKPVLDPRWHWNHQPRADKWSLTERPGFLRLHAFQQLEPGRFFKTRNVICQRHTRRILAQVTIRLELGSMTDEQEAGLVHFGPGNTSASIAVRKTGTALAMRFNKADAPTDGPALPAGTAALWLRSAAGFDDQCVFSFSTDGQNFAPLGEAYTLVGGGWRGDIVGIYTFNNQAERGYIDVDTFDYRF